VGRTEQEEEGTGRLSSKVKREKKGCYLVRGVNEPRRERDDKGGLEEREQNFKMAEKNGGGTLRGRGVFIPNLHESQREANEA